MSRGRVRCGLPFVLVLLRRYRFDLRALAAAGCVANFNDCGACEIDVIK